MRVRNGLAFWRVCVLGALNGFLYGEVAEIVHKIHNWYEVAAYSSDITLNYLLRLSPPPFVMAFFFMTSSYLIHRHWLSRPKSLLILWQVIGFAGVCGFVFMTFVFRPSNLFRLPDLWMRFLIGIILLALVNLVYRPKHLGKKLKQIRGHLELSQVGMAEALDFPSVHPTNISGYERGLREPPYPVLLKYARLVGVSTDIMIDDKLEIRSHKKRS